MSSDSSQPHHDDPPPPLRQTSLAGNVVRGALIGAVEAVPGVSGGTVALVVGIYHQLINSASAIVSAGRALISGPDRIKSAVEHLRQVDLRVVLPVMIGMLVGLFTAVQFIADWIENHPELTRAVFFGMVVASLAVPLRMITHMRWIHLLWGVLAAVVTFVVVSLPPGNLEPHWWILIPAAAIAVSALLLPGLSGSFLLLTMGLYESTIQAASDFDLGYLGIFALGLVLGVATVIKGLKWLLDHHHNVTMVILTGIMVGALRVLWPWQTESRDLLTPADNLGLIVGLAAAGFVAVAILVLLDWRIEKRSRAVAAANAVRP